MPQNDVDKILEEITIDARIMIKQFEGMPTDIATVKVLLMIVVAMANLKDSLNEIAGILS